MHGPTSQPGSFDYDHSVLVDAGGNILLDVGVIERVVHTPDGPVRERITPMVELSDGRIWDRNGGAVVPGGVCQLCRQQAANRHPVVSQVAGMSCAACGDYTCPQHRRLFEQHVLCLVCWRAARRMAILRSLFYSG